MRDARALGRETEAAHIVSRIARWASRSAHPLSKSSQALPDTGSREPYPTCLRGAKETAPAKLVYPFPQVR